MKKTTDAFYYNVDELFIVQNYLFPYVTQEIDNSGIKYMKLDNYDAEEKIRFGMCKKIIKNIESLIDFQGQKTQYKKLVKNLTRTDLDYSEFFKKKKHYDETLMLIAKFEYVKNKYKNENYIRNDLHVLGYLTALLIKLQDKHNKLNPPLINHMISRTKLYRYIKEATLEELQINISTYEKCSIEELMEILYNITINYDYEQENKTVEPALAIEHNSDDINDLGHYVQDYYHVHIIDEDNTFTKYREQKEQEIHNWLVDQMHEISEGKTF